MQAFLVNSVRRGADVGERVSSRAQMRGGCMQDFFGRLPRAERKSAIKDEGASELELLAMGKSFGRSAERLRGMSV